MLHQEHIAAHMITLSETDQLEMVKQIEDLDFTVLSADETNEERGAFAPLFATTLSEIEAKADKFSNIGLEAISHGLSMNCLFSSASSTICSMLSGKQMRGFRCSL